MLAASFIFLNPCGLASPAALRPCLFFYVMPGRARGAGSLARGAGLERSGQK